MASPRVNRHEKSGKDAAEWVPALNRCWFAGRVVEVRKAYGLTIDRREAAALERILAGCERTALESVVCTVPSAAGPAPLPHLRVGTMRSLYTTTTGTDGLPARRLVGTGLLRSRDRIRRTGTCGMGMGTESSASSRVAIPVSRSSVMAQF